MRIPRLKEYVIYDGLNEKLKPLLDKKEELEKKIEEVKSQEVDKTVKKSREEQRKTLQNYIRLKNKLERGILQVNEDFGKKEVGLKWVGKKSKH